MFVSITRNRALHAPGMNSSDEPYDKKKRKQKMTSEQLDQLYAKLPRVQYDSDDEPVRCGTPQHVLHARAAAVEALAPVSLELTIPQGAPTSIVHYSGAQYSPTQRDALWELELLAAIDSQRTTTPRRRSSNRSLFGDSADDESFGGEGTDGTSDDAYDPDRVVTNPFYPDLACTAAERDACLDDAQSRRYEEGLPLLVQNPLDPEHWVEPPLVCVVGEDVTDDEDPHNLPGVQATPVA